ncbi:uroporphyrinogen-III synthase [Methylobacterium sp. Leaf89]|uniref:uroporphyrinogen-III synthase n=1 Tax=Methylobacterium sp. Leaf89 TaxID=1736245 RepID=UPI000701509F|nr:uroporphyrinogen-III synthase [Methylobacterium sp. Leaf89]KQO71094.1 uroporphyrinogen III synthase [Methylobacterium sp. Leaf89]
MRIWVARPEPGAARTGARLAALGHRPLLAPVLTVAPTGFRLPEETFAGLILTSANAAAALTPAERARLRAVPTFAVGARTAALARELGFADVREAEGDARALARLVRASLPMGAHLVHAAGAERKAEPAASLIAAGYRLAVCELYAARGVARLPDAAADALAGRRLDGALHYSRRSAQAAHDLATAAGLGGAFGDLTHYCLSADVAAPLVTAGVAVHFVPDRPGEDALLAGLPAPGPTGFR